MEPREAMQPPLGGGTAGEGRSPGLRYRAPSYFGSWVLPALSHPDWTAKEKEGWGDGATVQNIVTSKCRAGTGTKLVGPQMPSSLC